MFLIRILGKTAQGATKIFAVDVHQRQIHVPKTRAYDICPSIKQVFVNDVLNTGILEAAVKRDFITLLSDDRTTLCKI